MQEFYRFIQAALLAAQQEPDNSLTLAISIPTDIFPLSLVFFACVCVLLLI